MRIRSTLTEKAREAKRRGAAGSRLALIAPGGLAALAMLAAALFAPAAVAAPKRVDLAAVKTNRRIFGRTIPFWVFDDASRPGVLARRVPGPQISVGANQSLEITLTNSLDEPTSVIIPGQPMPEVQEETAPGTWTPVSPQGVVRMHGGDAVIPGADNRIRSLVPETPPGGRRRYVWRDLAPGTYLYQSGTHIQVQIQMGLYGAVVKNAAPKTVYPGLEFGTQATLVFSEIDPDLHDSVAAGTYGDTAGAVVIPTTIDYRPQYFLINGFFYNVLDADGKPVPLKRVTLANNPNRKPLLVRLLNAGLKNHVPTLLGSHFRIVAENGRPYNNAREQYSTLLLAGQTKDILLDIPSNGKYALFDHRFFRTGGSAARGGVNGGLAGYILIDM